MITRRALRTCVAILAVASTFSTPREADAQGRTHAVIVVGLGGTQEYRTRFHTQALALKAALTVRHGIPAENVTYLGEKPAEAPDVVAAKSTRANVLQTLGEISQRAQPMDRLLVILIGHGTSDRNEAQFNLSGPDLTPTDFQTGLIAFPTQTLALVHTGSASGGFVAPLSGPNRIIVTATKTERERNATEFPQFFVEAMTTDEADLDKDERTSLLEAFLYARAETERYYDEENEYRCVLNSWHATPCLAPAPGTRATRPGGRAPTPGAREPRGTSNGRCRSPPLLARPEPRVRMMRAP